MVETAKIAQQKAEEAHNLIHDGAMKGIATAQSVTQDVSQGQVGGTGTLVGGQLVGGYDAANQLVGNVGAMAFTQVEHLFEVDEQTLMQQNEEAMCFRMSDTSMAIFGPESDIRKVFARALNWEMDLLLLQNKKLRHNI